MLMGRNVYGRDKAFQSVRGAQSVSMWTQAIDLLLLLLLTAVLQPSQQIFTVNRKSDLFDIVYPPQVQRRIQHCDVVVITRILSHQLISQSEKPEFYLCGVHLVAAS
jgi:hypothetical protein